MTTPASSAASSGRNAAMVGAGIFLSRIFGLLRTALMARYLGDTIAGDAVAAATKMPNLLQNLLGEGALSASFIPVYSRLVSRGEHEAARRVAGAVVAMLALVTSLVVVVGIIAAPVLTSVLNPAFTGERRELTILLARIIFPGTGVLVLSAWALGVLNSHRRFLLPYAAPVASNLAIIGALLWYGPRLELGPLAVRLAWASVVGALLQLFVQLPMVLRLLGGVRLGVGRGDPDVATVRRNLVPAITSRGALQISGYIDVVIAGYLGVGMVSIQMFASTLYMLPVSLFGMSIAASELPELSQHAGDSAEAATVVRARLSLALSRVAFFIVPSAVAFLALGDVIIGLVLRGREFGADAAMFAWGMLAGSAVGLLAATMGRLYSSTFFAFHDTRTPRRYAILRIAFGASLGALGALLLPRAMGVDLRWGGLALTLAGSLAGWLEYLLLRRTLGHRIGPTGLPHGRVLRLAAAALFATLVAFALKLSLLEVSRYVSAPIVLTAFAAAYGAAAYALAIPEAIGLVTRVLRPRGRP